MSRQRLFLLKGKVQHYAWGGNSFIPDLLGVKNNENLPFAEYWMGGHDQVPSSIIAADETEQPVNLWIDKDKETILGKQTAEQFGRLPFLFKVLDVKEMLSIQVHPTREEAIKGFAKEEAAGIPITDSSRNYKDDNHKPEVMVALSDFWLLHGFRRKTEILKVLQEHPSFNSLVPVLEEKGIKGLYQAVMNASQEDVDKMLLPLAKEVLPLYQAGKLKKADPGFWAARAIEQYSGGKMENLDRGIFSIYFFNLLNLKEGEGIFQSAGIPHAYLEGQNMELMANSDNVLRGGLTPKHIDVTELIKHTSFEEIVPKILPPQEDYTCPVPDFSISRYELTPQASRERITVSAEIIFVKQGVVQLEEGETVLKLGQGQAAIVIAQTAYWLKTNDSGAECFIAGVGDLAV